MMKKVSVDNFRSDPMFPRIERVVAEQLAKGNVLAPVGVLIGMGLLRPEHRADWRRGRVAYLEHVVNCNLSRLSRLLRILRFHAHDLNLKPSLTVYKRHGKGPRQQLRFSKTGDPNLEAAYATHLIRPGQRPLSVGQPRRRGARNKSHHRSRQLILFAEHPAIGATPMAGRQVGVFETASLFALLAADQRNERTRPRWRVCRAVM
jgi:hypothetical protein